MDPLTVHWDRTVIPAADGDPMIVCCLTNNSQPVALLLDDELREALILQLVDPDGVMDQPSACCTAKRGELVMACKTCGVVIDHADAFAQPCEDCGAWAGMACGPACLPSAHN